MKNATISPVIDCAEIVGFVVEYMPILRGLFHAYFIDELIGAFSSKVEAAAELLLHVARGVAH